MKEIQPISVWYNGNLISCKYLNAWASNLVLNTNAFFIYQLLDENQDRIIEGTLQMDNEDYINWNQDSFAWDWIANKLNLVYL
jgi:hypothetical protein